MSPLGGGFMQLYTYGAQNCYLTGECESWMDKVKRYLGLPKNYKLPPRLPPIYFSKLKEILNYPQHKELPPRLPPIYFSKLKEVLNYPQHKDLPKLMHKGDLELFRVFRQFNSSENIKLKSITSLYKITQVYMIFTTLAGHPILLSNCDKILINNKYRKVNDLLIHNTGLYCFFHNEQNKYKRKCYISTNIKNINIKMCVQNATHDFIIFSGFPKILVKYLKKRDDNLEKIKMNPEELERELVAWYWKPERFELFKWQLDLE
jgi:hypothetical protein